MPDRRPLLLFVLALAACGSSPSTPPPTPSPEATATPSAPGALPDALVLGLWSEYPAPDADEWAVAPLDDLRWAVAAAELACSDRAHQGDMEAQREGARRVLAHHQTTAAAVMDYGIAVNADPDRATELGERVAVAAENCS